MVAPSEAVAQPSVATPIALATPPPCEPCDSQSASEGSGGILVGPAWFNLSSLDARLSSAGYSRIGQPLFMIGGEGRAVFPRGFVAGARGAGLLGRDGHGPNGFTTSFGGGFGMLDFGYAFVHEKSALLTLTGGLGGYGLSLDISDGQAATFDELLQNPRRTSSLSRGGFLLGLTLGFDGRVPIGKDKHDRQGFFTIGARLGTLYGPTLDDWQLSGGGKASGGPRHGLVGGFAALVIGFGGSPRPRH